MPSKFIVSFSPENSYVMGDLKTFGARELKRFLGDGTGCKLTGYKSDDRAAGKGQAG